MKRPSTLIVRHVTLLMLVGGCVALTTPTPQERDDFEITPEVRAALDSISADALEEHLTYIASDELGGRDTPSPGLDLAAEYIAAQFAAAGLEAVGDDGYFQTARWHVSNPAEESFSLEIDAGDGPMSIDLAQTSVEVAGPLEVSDAVLFKIDVDDAETLGALNVEQVEGAVAVVEMPSFRSVPRARMREVFMRNRRLMQRMAELGAATVLAVDRESSGGAGFGRPSLVDPDNPFPRTGLRSGVPRITVHGGALLKMFDDADAGPMRATVTIGVGEPEKEPVALRNVVGLIRGSDPELKDTYVMVTGHYDHVGTQLGRAQDGDAIFNGANDDGSGTVSVIELATALARIEPRPRRSIIFMCVFGEERGLLGSRFYGSHPIFPIEHTVADVNLEQVGRTDSTEGPQIRNASMTGIDYSDVGAIFARAGELTDIEVYKHPMNSDAYFGRSDNQALADQGVPAHTICVAYNYADYHGAGDHADKIDYENMAAVNRMIAVGILMIAQSDDEPRWNPDEAKAKRYLEAWRARRGIESTTD